MAVSAIRSQAPPCRSIHLRMLAGSSPPKQIMAASGDLNIMAIVNAIGDAPCTSGILGA